MEFSFSALVCFEKAEEVGTIKFMKQKSAYRKRESRHD